MSLDENDILVVDGGDISCWCETAFNFWAFEGRKIGGVIANGPWEQMGTGPAYATAVKMSKPNSRVILITGDGALGLSPGLTPLETAIDREIPITVVVANNAKWGMIHEQQAAM
jgi:acetolactate synthase-1/2/3 large subunit